MKALTFSTFGTSDVLEYIDIPSPTLKKEEILVEMRAIGLNFADVYRRKENYHLNGISTYSLKKIPIILEQTSIHY